MDDEVGPCGGSLLIMREAGAELHVVYISDSSGDCPRGRWIASTRRKEAQEVSEFMGFNSVAELSFPDGDLHKHEPAITNHIARLIGQLDPDLVLCPFPADSHSDHMVCARSTGRAATQAKWRGVIWAYEVWTALWPNIAVDISRVRDRKEHAIHLYGSQMQYRDYAGAALGLNRFRGLHHGVDYAEAFYECGPAHFERLSAMLDEI